MGAVVAVLLPGAPMPLARLRSELFLRYGLDWEAGAPPDGGPPDGAPALRPSSGRHGAGQSSKSK